MTRIEKAVTGIISLLITVSIVVTLIISIAMSNQSNQQTYELMASTGVRVLKDDVDIKLRDLEATFKGWVNQTQMKNALKNGYVGTLAEIYTNANLGDNVYCMFTDGAGNIVWKSDNYKLAKYDVSGPLSFDSSKHVEFDSAEDDDYNVMGLYADENVPLSCVFTAPVVFGNTTLVGICFMGYDLSDNVFLDEIKEQTGNDMAIYAGDAIAATTLLAKDAKVETAEEEEPAEGEEIDEEAAEEAAAKALAALPRNVGEIMDNSINEKILAGESYVGSAVISGQKYFSCYEPITDIYGNVVGSYYAGQSSNQNDASFFKIIVVSVIAALVIIAVAMLIIRKFLSVVIAKPIVAVSELAAQMSQGHIDVPDFTTKFGNNEVGDFARSLENTKHDLARYIRDISAVLTAMANGDFTVTPSVEYEGDFKAISQAFEMIRTRLRGIVHGIAESSDQVLTGSDYMASGSQTLAEGTCTQASAVEELNATVISISQKISVNAENALRAKNLSAGVETSAVEQNSDMSNVITAMNEIELKSSEISSIIKTIDDIAFQTNILALNASVEAARAGAAGKGFAVVADEVRNLATKSAEAANRTDDLISATVAAVKDGTERVNAAAESMLEITRKAKETSRLIDEISAASAEQAVAIRQVSTGIEKIADVVQENSATAEETAASCEQLRGQSKVLRNQIAMLKA